MVGVHALIATGVNADGHREILGLHLTSAEDGAGWLAFFRDLTARGLTGVRLVTFDAHAGLTAAIGATLPAAGCRRSSAPTGIERFMDSGLAQAMQDAQIPEPTVTEFEVHKLVAGLDRVAAQCGRGPFDQVPVGPVRLDAASTYAPVSSWASRDYRWRRPCRFVRIRRKTADLPVPTG